MKVWSRLRGAGDRPAAAGIQGLALLVLGATTAVWLHLRAGLRFPPPWPDETHFMIPAWNLADDLTLRAPELAAPDGIMWIPDGWYVALAPVLALFGPSLEAARWFSFALTLATAVGLVALGARLGAGPRLSAGVAAVWLATPHVALMGNLARMESLLALMAVAALLLAVHDRWPVALSAAAAAILVHPVALAFAVPLAAVAVAGGVRLRPRGWEWLPVLSLVVAVAGEAVWMATRWSLVTDHLGYQLRLKQSAASSGEGGTAAFAALAVMAAAGAVLAAVAGRDRTRAARATAALPFAVAAGLALIRVVGVMQWYTALSLELALALLVLGGAAALPHVRHRLPTVQRLAGLRWLPAAGMAAVVVLLLLAARATTAGTVFELRMDAAGSGEWDRFARAATAEIHRLDGGRTGPATLMFDPLSGFPATLLDEDLENIEVVAMTPVTGSLDQADLWALSPGAAKAHPALVREVEDLRPVIDVRSESGAFELLVYEAPRGAPRDGR